MDLSITKMDFNANILKKAKFMTFSESGLEILMLIHPYKTNSGKRYMFGMIENEIPFWLFKGKSIAKDRSEMKDIYLELIQNTTENQVVFVYKGNLFGSKI